MKTTIDIPNKELEDAIRFTGASTKREAVVTAISDYNRRQRMAGLTRYSGTFTGMPDNDQIEGFELERMKRLHGEDFEFSTPDDVKAATSKAPGRLKKNDMAK